MKTLELRRSYRGKDITMTALLLPQGLHVSLYGGDLAHIGAVGIVAPDGTCSVTEFPHHREGILCEKWTAALASEGFCPAVVEAGIHYDGLDRPGIQTVLELTDSLLAELMTEHLKWEKE